MILFLLHTCVIGVMGAMPIIFNSQMTVLNNPVQFLTNCFIYIQIYIILTLTILIIESDFGILISKSLKNIEYHGVIPINP